MEPFLIKSLLAGIGVATMCGTLGCFVAWQRLAYFGDTIAHAALLGVVMSLLLGWNLEFGIIGVAALIAVFVAYMERQKQLASDTVLGIAAHGALAIGLVLLALSKTITVDINGYLFGDVLAVSNDDIIRIYLCTAAILAIVAYLWRDLMRLTLHPDIAQVEGVNVKRLRLILMLLIALAVAISIKIVGLLLITSLLIIPAACARYFSKTPTQMVFLASVAGILAVIGGMAGSLHFDTPSGPSIIVAALGLFFVAYGFKSTTTGT